MKKNETMMQYFEWYLPNDGLLWRQIAAQAKSLADQGITQLWMPPAYKGSSQGDVGYGVYDLYDLGEFDQKGTIRTKYGTKDEYLAACQAIHDNGMQVIADIVINHRMGADELEEVNAIEVCSDDRNKDIGEAAPIKAWTKFTYPGRNGAYSDYIWTWRNFSGTDWDDRAKRSALFRFEGKRWNSETDHENGNYDYLMGADLDTDYPESMEELKKWLIWYKNQAGINGLRLDAVKHIGFEAYAKLLDEVREATASPLEAVGEYWSSDLDDLNHYLDVDHHTMRLFDVPLHHRFHDASCLGREYCMKDIFSQTLLEQQSDWAVTFVDNHDTEPGQALESFVEPWFKPLAYALILLREKGLPCVFYGDYYGIPSYGIAPTAHLPLMLRVRKDLAYGEEVDYLEDDHLLGFVRRGDQDHPYSGIAVLMSNTDDGTQRMEMGGTFAGQTFYDVTGTITEPILIDEDGWGEFHCKGGNVSIYVTHEAYVALRIEK